jgi:hypothetical protein
MDEACQGCGAPGGGNVCCPLCDTYLAGPTRRLRRALLWAGVLELYLLIIGAWATHFLLLYP